MQGVPNLGESLLHRFWLQIASPCNVNHYLDEARAWFKRRVWFMVRQVVVMVKIRIMNISSQQILAFGKLEQ